MGAAIEDDGIVIGIADGQMRDHGVAGVAPDAIEDAAIVRIVHPTSHEDHLIASRITSDGDVVAAIHIQGAGKVVRPVRQDNGISSL